MRITSVKATPLNVPVTVDAGGKARTTSLSICLVEIGTADGLTGHGMTAITEEEVVTAAINHVVAPALLGEDADRTEGLWERLNWLLSPRGQTGYAMHAVAAVDLALWDLRAKRLGLPVWRLLGGARSRVPVYATVGFGFYEREELAQAMRAWRGRGWTRLKMTVGGHALARRDEPRPMGEVIDEDVRRVAAVREAIGDDAALFIDANCGLVLFHAARLAARVEPMRIEFFEEPITQNDIGLMAQLRRRTSIPLAAGQNEGRLFRFRDLLVGGAVDVLQPNVAISGGLTQCVNAAALAQSFNVPIDNGGAWPFHNMHLHAGVMNGGMVEYHHVAVELPKQVFDDLPVPVDGWYRGASQMLPDVAGAQVPLGVVSAAAGLSQARAGRVKALAMMSPDRLPGVEGVVAPLADAVPGFDVAPSRFVLAPAGLPAGIAAKLGDAVRLALANPATEQAAASQGAVRSYGDAAALQAAMAKESDLFTRVIRDQKLSAEGG